MGDKQKIEAEDVACRKNGKSQSLEVLYKNRTSCGWLFLNHKKWLLTDFLYLLLLYGYPGKAQPVPDHPELLAEMEAADRPLGSRPGK